jgi:transcriptional regulator with XRE-family HTH domain
MAQAENKHPWTRLVELREAKGYNQNELARILGVTPLTYYRWENGIFQPSNEMLVKLADALETTTDYLLGRDIDNTLTPGEVENLKIAEELLHHLVKKCSPVSKNEKGQKTKAK